MTDSRDPADAYQSLAETVGHDDPRWAFGAGRAVEDVATEITAPVPDGVDPADLAQYCLMLGDDALILAQRLAEWITNAPELEEEVALGQHRARPARSGPGAAGPRRALRGAAATRTPWPTCGPRRSSATSRSPSCPTTSTSPARSPGC